MKVLVLGASGATGRLAAAELLSQGHEVVALVRNSEALHTLIGSSNQLTVIEETALSIAQDRLTDIVASCDSVICCLGHTLSFKGIYGAPRMLVRDSLKRVCESVLLSANTDKTRKPLRVVLMNSTGCRNLDVCESISMAQHVVLGLIRCLVPPHLDNEKAGNYLRKLSCNDSVLEKKIEWVVVRPDSLIDEQNVSEYECHPSPIRSAIFDSGKTSRINVGNFMAKLVLDEAIWKQWKGRMPVIYNLD